MTLSDIPQPLSLTDTVLLFLIKSDCHSRLIFDPMGDRVKTAGYLHASTEFCTSSRTTCAGVGLPDRIGRDQIDDVLLAGFSLQAVRSWPPLQLEASLHGFGASTQTPHFRAAFNIAVSPYPFLNLVKCVMCERQNIWAHQIDEQTTILPDLCRLRGCRQHKYASCFLSTEVRAGLTWIPAE